MKTSMLWTELLKRTGIDPRIRAAFDTYRWTPPYASMLPSGNSPAIGRPELLKQLAETATRMRLQLKTSDGEMPYRIDVKRYFVTHNRLFSIRVPFQFFDAGDGRFGTGIDNAEEERLKYIDRAARMFLN